MGSVSKMLCIVVLACAPACLGDDPDLLDQGATGGLGAAKFNRPVDQGVENSKTLPPPPKTRVRPDPVGSTLAGGDYVEVDSVDQSEWLHHFDDTGEQIILIRQGGKTFEP